VSIGVLLGGCGHYDGTDAHELAFTLLSVEAAGERTILIAPDITQERTVDHLSGDEVQEPRNVLRESARLARRPIRSLEAVRHDELEALLIPGGYGPVVNFSTGFARQGAERRMNPEIAAFLRHFLDTGKPIGCVSLGEIPVRTVLGGDIEVPPPPAGPQALTIDRERSIVHTPGFTAFTRLVDVKAGIEAMVGEVLRIVRERRSDRAAAARGTGETR
jgi:enhancing lycopene biosynthesis protein 2